MTVAAGDEIFHLQTINLSPFGAKIELADPPLSPGTPVHLHFRPPDGRVLDVQAIVWRIDSDGCAFFFIGVDRQDFSFPTEAEPGAAAQ